jgi:hypothetical protein
VYVLEEGLEVVTDGDSVVIEHSKGKTAATVIHVYGRDDHMEPTAAPTFRNMALAIFNDDARIMRAALFSTAGPKMFFLAEIAHMWFDIRGERAYITKVGN